METKKQQVIKFTNSRIRQISETRELGTTKALLASLRRGAGKTPGELPELWGAFLNELPEDLLGRTGKISPAEDAVYQALCLYALSTKGGELKNDPNEEGITLGRACGKLALCNENDKERILNRLKIVLASNQHINVHLRNLIKLLADKDIKLDFALLAGDLYSYHFPEGRDQVRLRWARDFYKKDNKAEEKKEGNKNE